MKNYDSEVVADFGKEWSAFNQRNLNEKEWLKLAQGYFSIFPWDKLPENPIGIDLGCGSGRWAKFVAKKVYKLICLDPSQDALKVAKRNLSDFSNITFINSTINNMQVKPESVDFAYSIGVLHHIPDTESALREAVKILKPGSPILIYVYYDLKDVRLHLKIIWKASNLLRKIISILPFSLKRVVCDSIAITIYFPLAKLSKFFKYLGFDSSLIPLNFYSDKSLYTMRTDSLDRFGTKLEKRFSKDEIYNLMVSVGLSEIRFSPEPPFWCAVGFKLDGQ